MEEPKLPCLFSNIPSPYRYRGYTVMFSLSYTVLYEFESHLILKAIWEVKANCENCDYKVKSESEIISTINKKNS